MTSWVLGEFPNPNALLGAAAIARDERLGELDTYTPYPVHGLEAAIGIERSTIGWVAFFGGTLGLLTAYGLQLYFNWWEFPLNIGNKPPHSPPVYVPVTFELMVLFASLFIVGSLIVWYWRFPRPHHPVFEHEAFVRTATTTGYWLSVRPLEVESLARVRERLEGLGARNVAVVSEAPEATGGVW
jgi:hypothetical protein